MNDSTKTALAVVGVIVLAGAFWILLLAPKRETASKLSNEVASLQSAVSSEDQRAAEGVAARHDFPHNYQQLVLLGKAVPGEAATASLLVQLNGISRLADTRFDGIQLGSSSGGTEETAAPAEGTGAFPPLGSKPGPAGLLAMPYDLKFEGGFFAIANFIQGLDSLVETKDGRVDANGRLVTIDGFSMTPARAGDQVRLAAEFAASTYVAPPAQALAAGATTGAPVALAASTSTLP